MAGTDQRSEATVRSAVDAFLSSPRLTNSNTRRAYTAVLDRMTSDVGTGQVLAEVSGDDLAEVVEQAWGKAAPATWNRNRAALSSVLAWCAKNRYPAPTLPQACPPGTMERKVGSKANS